MDKHAAKFNACFRTLLKCNRHVPEMRWVQASAAATRIEGSCQTDQQAGTSFWTPWHTHVLNDVSSQTDQLPWRHYTLRNGNGLLEAFTWAVRQTNLTRLRR